MGKPSFIKIYQKGSFDRTERFFSKLLSFDSEIDNILRGYGEKGCRFLRQNTPKDSGNTANRWNYEIVHRRGSVSIYFTNDSTTKTNPNLKIALLLQYGHGTRNGGYVQGLDYINPSLRKIFQQMSDEAWEEISTI